MTRFNHFINVVFFLSFFFHISVFAQHDAIQVRTDGKGWNILTPSSAYRFRVASTASGGRVDAICYGSRMMLENVILATA